MTDESEGSTGVVQTESGDARLLTDADARTHLANERTFLAWFRTGIALIAVGVAAASFLDLSVDALALEESVGIILALAGGMMIWLAKRRHDEVRADLLDRSFRAEHSGVRFAALAGLGVTALSIFLIITLWSGQLD